MKTLAEVRQALLIIESDIWELKRRQRELNELGLNLKAKECGVVSGETMIREIDYNGKPKRLGQFVRYYNKVDSSNWVTALLVKKNGEVGLRKATFFNWEKMK
jgi:hypothetical protein